MYPSEMYFALFNFSNSSIMSLVRFRSASSCLNSSFQTSLVTVLLEWMERGASCGSKRSPRGGSHGRRSLELRGGLRRGLSGGLRRGLSGGLRGLLRGGLSC